MPEAVEVYLHTLEIEKIVKSDLIIGFGQDKKSKFYKKGLNGVELIQLPLKIKRVFSRGKVIVFVCEKLFLVSQLGMTGRWTVTPSKHSNFWIIFGKRYKDSYVETFKLYFDDQRHFGNFSIVKSLDEIWKRHGPCWMMSSLYKYGKKTEFEPAQVLVTRDYWHQKVKASKMMICDFLLEQKYMSGVGNYLRCEAMYRGKIDPRKKCCELTKIERDLLYEKILETIYLAYRDKGPSNGYIDGGRFRLYVYGQVEDVKGNPIQTFQSKNRTVHYSILQV